MNIPDLDAILPAKETDQWRAMLNTFGGVAAYMAQYVPPPIQPKHTFAVYEDTKVITWTALAVCRP
jgi:hypothetical protein